MKLPKLKITKPRQLLLLGILLVTITALWIGLSKAAKHRTITEVQIVNNLKTPNALVDENYIKQSLFSKCGNPIGHSISSLNLSLFENTLENIGFIKKAQVYAELNGVLKLKVVYRNPILRVKNNQNQEFYMDSTGHKFQMKGILAVESVPISGFVPEPNLDQKVKTYQGQQLAKLAAFLVRNPMWKMDFEQAYVDNKSQIIVIPRVGSHSIDIGDANNLEEKFANLRVFYRNALSAIGWDKYQTIVIKYKNQVLGKPSITQNKI